MVVNFSIQINFMLVLTCSCYQKIYVEKYANVTDIKPSTVAENIIRSRRWTDNFIFTTAFARFLNEGRMRSNGQKWELHDNAKRRNFIFRNKIVKGLKN